MTLEGRVALVTGGGTGLGRAISLQLAEAGCDVAVNYSRSEREADETAAAIRDIGRRAHVVRADVADDLSVRAMVEDVVGQLGGLDVLVNNAGRRATCRWPTWTASPTKSGTRSWPST